MTTKTPGRRRTPPPKDSSAASPRLVQAATLYAKAVKRARAAQAEFEAKQVALREAGRCEECRCNSPEVRRLGDASARKWELAWAAESTLLKVAEEQQ